MDSAADQKYLVNFEQEMSSAFAENLSHITTTSTTTHTLTSTNIITTTIASMTANGTNNNSELTYDVASAAAASSSSSSNFFYWTAADGVATPIANVAGTAVSFNASQTFANFNDTEYFMFSERCSFMDSNNISYWNITCDNPLEYVVPLYGYFMPFLLVITVLSNSLIVLVLSKKNMATPTNFVLMAMALCDMFTVIFPAPGLLYMFTFGNHYKPLHPVSMCLAYTIFNEIMPAMFHTASIWLTLALAVQRYIYVCHAPMARTWCTMPRVKRSTIYIAIVAFLHQSTRFFDRTFYPLSIEWNGQQTEVCHVETSPWVHNYIGEDVYFTLYFLFRVLFVHLLPCILLVTLNILLFNAMRQAHERRKLLFRENRKKECKKLRESNCTTLMLIVVVTVFLIVEIPIAVVTAMHIVSTLIHDFLDYEIANVCILFTNFFLVVSYPINFGIYCGMSRQFRVTFKEIFLGHIVAKKENSSKYSIVNGPRTCTNTNETVL